MHKIHNKRRSWGGGGEHICIPRTQMTLVLIGRGLVLGGWPSQIEVIGVLGIYVILTIVYTLYISMKKHIVQTDSLLSQLSHLRFNFFGKGSFWGPGWKRISGDLLAWWKNSLQGSRYRGHYITNPNDALFRGNPSTLPYMCIVWFPQMGKFMIPEVYNRECQMNIFEVLATSSTSEVVCGPVIDLTDLGLNIPNTPLKLQITEHLNLQRPWKQPCPFADLGNFSLSQWEHNVIINQWQ